MRLSLFLAPMMILLVQTDSLAKGKDDSAITCRSSNPHEMDAAHLIFELSGNLDYKSIVKVANEMVEESSDPDIQQIEVRQSIDYEYRDLPVLVYDTGKYKKYQLPEKVLEFVVIRPVKECFDAEGQTYNDKTFVYSRAFEKEEINIAVVRQLLDNNVILQALTNRGQAWICAVSPENPECATLNP